MYFKYHHFCSLCMCFNVIVIFQLLVVSFDAYPGIEEPNYQTTFNEEFLEALTIINDDMSKWAFQENEDEIFVSSFDEIDIYLLTQPYKKNWYFLKKKVASLEKLEEILDSVECYHTLLCLYILKNIKNDIKIKISNPKHEFNIRFETFRKYLSLMISLFVRGRFFLNPWQLKLLKKIKKMAIIEQLNKDMITEENITYFYDTELFTSIYKFTEQCQFKQYLPESLTLSDIEQSQPNLQSTSHNEDKLSKYVMKLLNILNVHCIQIMESYAEALSLDVYKNIVDDNKSNNVSLTREEFEEKKRIIFNLIKVNKSEIEALQKDSYTYYKNDLWNKNRGLRLNTKKFGKICKMKYTASIKNALKQVFYHLKINNDDLMKTRKEIESNIGKQYGIKNEIVAKEDFKKITGKTIKPCGVFIDEKFNFLIARPDGLVGDDAIIEIKCPYKIRNCSPEEAAISSKLRYLIYMNSKITLNKSCDEYYQVQGQLHITKRKLCYFVVWTNKGLSVAKVLRDDTFWKEKMEKKLIDFYMDHMIPKIIQLDLI
ncbi:uncharacterized protein LOC126896993 [Daktulosphaira vitifoliae]|uniref:uncharacterized protein LOC126896993 n=1 Tax=Daktulosphaira vitifoliae TaxID=58002 RepID=UPI0021A9B6DD|nr:uncharacterized protein LOC126896993 [Daktulosphaira vitifoliae]